MWFNIRLLRNRDKEFLLHAGQRPMRGGRWDTHLLTMPSPSPQSLLRFSAVWCNSCSMQPEVTLSQLYAVVPVDTYVTMTPEHLVEAAHAGDRIRRAKPVAPAVTTTPLPWGEAR